MRHIMKLLFALAALALIIAAVIAVDAAQPTFMSLEDDGVASGLRDRYEAACNGKEFISGTVIADSPADSFTVSVLCTQGVESKGNVGSNTALGTVTATVGPKCSRATIDIFCANSLCPGPDCGGYTVVADCLTSSIQRLEFMGDDIP
jgi:hypothetical protein